MEITLLTQIVSMSSMSYEASLTPTATPSSSRRVSCTAPSPFTPARLIPSVARPQVLLSGLMTCPGPGFKLLNITRDSKSGQGFGFSIKGGREAGEFCLFLCVCLGVRDVRLVCLTPSLLWPRVEAEKGGAGETR